MTQTILFMSPMTCSRVSMTALEELGIDFEDRLIFIGAGAQNDPEYLALNRKGKVPALSLDGTVMTETPAILTYLHRQHPAAGLLPSGDALSDAQGLSDLSWCSSTLHLEARQNRAPQKLTVGDPAGVLADGRAKFAKSCDYIASRVSDGRWWYGADWSIVDTYVYWGYSTAASAGFPLGDYPALVAHAERVRSRPSFQRMLQREIAAVEREYLPMDVSTL